MKNSDRITHRLTDNGDRFHDLKFDCCNYKKCDRSFIKVLRTYITAY
ncbi:MAG: hypothetical protein MUD14_07700 [Hydrococcus sp. Prado102]|nr:hypothetical protein [Hydrococcus sp. Prado102]